MDVVLAMDLKNGYVVHGCSGNRKTYTPLTWGVSLSAEPKAYLSVVRPKYLYAADLDRIGMYGDNTWLILQLAEMVAGLWVDRGCRTPAEYLVSANTHNIVGTETADAPMDEFDGGFLSVDVKDSCVIPSGACPEEVLRRANATNFDGCILLNISSVGTSCGIEPEYAENMRSCSDKALFYGGGVRSVADLETLVDAGFDGVIVATAVHKGTIPLKIIQEGSFC
ncbi:MAG: nickel transporter [Methanocalculaceae archaeon]|jgi:phosphoribosylformimino-5-aminoimidazole carboxamide ribotide isomerase|nr:nickel transporter [Methanocalculaceae archaeon]